MMCNGFLPFRNFIEVFLTSLLQGALIKQRRLLGCGERGRESGLFMLCNPEKQRALWAR